MRIFSITLVFFIFSTLASWGQIGNSDDDNLNFNFHELNEAFEKAKNSNTSKNLLLTYINESQKLKSKEHEVKFLLLLSQYYETTEKEYGNALSMAYDALSVLNDSDANIPSSAWVYLRLSNLTEKIGAYEDAIAYRKLRQIDLFKMGRVKQAEKINNYLGQLYIKLNQLDSAYNYFHSFLSYCSKVKNTERQAFSYNNIAFTFELRGQYNEAKENYLNSVNLYSKVKDSGKQFMMANVYLNLARTYLKLNQKKQSRKYLELSKELFTKLNKPLNLAQLYYIEAQLNFNLEKDSKARFFIDSALSILNRNKEHSKKKLELLENIYTLGTEINTFNGQYKKNNDYHNKLLAIKDSLYNKEHLREMLLRRSKLQSLLIKREVELRKAEREKQEVKLAVVKQESVTQARGLVILILLSIVLALIYAYRFNKQKKKLQIDQLNRDLLEAKNELQAKRLKETTLTMVRKNEFVKDLKKRLRSMEKISQEDKMAIQVFLDNEIYTDGSLAEMEKLDLQLGDEFFAKIKQKYPTITQNELLLCGWLKMKITTKQIAALKNISLDSVKVAKYRLARKMGIEKGVSLFDHLNGDEMLP